jgi:hypothetical protein
LPLKPRGTAFQAEEAPIRSGPWRLLEIVRVDNSS